MMNYDDIINLPHHRSATRQPMPMEARAAQFAPFAALPGHGEAIDETARSTDRSPDPADDELRYLSICLDAALSMSPRPVVKIVYFIHDGRKNGGAYHTAEGRIMKVDRNDGFLVMEDKTEIKLKCVVAIDGDFETS